MVFESGVLNACETHMLVCDVLVLRVFLLVLPFYCWVVSIPLYGFHSVGLSIHYLKVFQMLPVFGDYE